MGLKYTKLYIDCNKPSKRGALINQYHVSFGPGYLVYLGDYPVIWRLS